MSRSSFSLFHDAPWRSLAYFLIVTFVALFGPAILFIELMYRLPERVMVDEIMYYVGFMAGLLGWLLWVKAWNRLPLDEHFIRWDTWSETLDYPLGGRDE